MNWGLDTSFVVRLLTEDPPEQAEVAKNWLFNCIEKGVRPKIIDIVVLETYFALQSYYHVPKADALQAIHELLESGAVEPVGFALEILRTSENLASAKPGFADRIIHAELRSSNTQLLTFEKSASNLPGVRVL
jgi:predicted nucleic-acid-binding protein